VLLALTLVAQPLRAQTYNVLHRFTGGPDGAYPVAGLLMDVAGNLYGTTSEGGGSGCGGAGCGTVFKVTKAGNETVLYSFCTKRNCADGAIPYGGLILDGKGNLYGTTTAGGKSNNGTVFKLETNGKEIVLYSFAGYPNDGAVPQASLIRDAAGTLYSVTTYGGKFGDGVVFKLDKTGKETVLYNFTGGRDGGNPEYGSLLRDTNGDLYDTTFTGGSSSICQSEGCGTLFKVDATGKEQGSTQLWHLVRRLSAVGWFDSRSCWPVLWYDHLWRPLCGRNCVQARQERQSHRTL
jgi:uncharacterized repeat protein (TIGR03803 family)